MDSTAPPGPSDNTTLLDLGLLLAQLIVILGASRLVGRAVGLLGQPRVIGEMIAGIALGPSLLGVFAPGASHALFPSDRLLPLATLSQLGVLLFMFVVGLRLDRDVLRGHARTAVAVSQASIALPFALGALIATGIHPVLAGVDRGGNAVPLLPFALFIGAAMSVTAFPVLARILTERGLVGTRLGSVAIACAAVDDVTAWCILAGVVAVARAENALGVVMLTISGAAIYATLMITAGRRGLVKLGRWWTARSGGLTAETVGVAVLFALASALVTEKIGVHALFGAFLGGVIIPRESGIAETLADRIEPVVTTVFLPIFFAFTGLRTETGLVSGHQLWAICGVLIAAAVVGKLAGSAIAARATGSPWREAVALGLLLNTRGLMELVVLNVGLELGVISPTLFAMMVLMALVTTVMTTPLLALVLRGSAVLTPAVRAERT